MLKVVTIKAFELKARLTLIKYLEEVGIKFYEIERNIRCGKKVVSE